MYIAYINGKEDGLYNSISHFLKLNPNPKGLIYLKKIPKNFFYDL